MSTAAGSPSDGTAISKKHRVPDSQNIDQIYSPTAAPTGPNRTA